MNSAHRIREILQRLHSYGGAQSTAASLAWEHAFQLHRAPEDERDDLVVLGLQAMRSEVGAIISALESTGVPEHLFRGQLNALHKVVQPKRMGDQWQSHAPVVHGAELSTVLGWAAYVLPDSEDALEDSSLTDLLECIEQLEESLRAAQLPEAIRAFMAHQVDLLRRAVLLYPVSGSKGIKRATAEAMGQSIAERHTLERERAGAPDATEEAVTRWGRMMSKAADICDKADKLNKAASTGASLYEKMLKTIEWAAAVGDKIS